MSNHRSDLRTAARAALAAAPYFRDFYQLKAWSSAVDTDALPILFVAIVRELSASATYDDDRKTVDMIITSTRAYSDAIEDVMDADAAAIEAAVLPALSPLCIHVSLAQLDFSVNAEGASRIGTTTARITCMLFTDSLL